MINIYGVFFKNTFINEIYLVRKLNKDVKKMIRFVSS
jgi:hypothetical protein